MYFMHIFKCQRHLKKHFLFHQDEHINLLEMRAVLVAFTAFCQAVVLMADTGTVVVAYIKILGFTNSLKRSSVGWKLMQ